MIYENSSNDTKTDYVNSPADDLSITNTPNTTFTYKVTIQNLENKHKLYTIIKSKRTYKL